MDDEYYVAMLISAADDANHGSVNHAKDIPAVDDLLLSFLAMHDTCL